jgi:hypothetical protein
MEAASNRRLTVTQQYRLSQTSSLYTNDGEWNRQIARLSTRSEWMEPSYRNSLAISNELVNEPPAHDNASDLHDIENLGHEKGYDATFSSLEISRDLNSRNFCIFALVLGIAVGVASLATGCQIIVSGKVLLPDFLRGK